MHFFHFRGEGIEAGEGKGHASGQGEVMTDSQLGLGLPPLPGLEKGWQVELPQALL